MIGSAMTAGDHLPSVLVVDDELNIRELVQVALRFHGFMVSTAASGSDALEQAAAQQPDLVVLDVTMPQMDGFGAARELRRRGCSAKIIFLTVQRGDEFVTAALESGGLAYVLKSRMYSDLVHAVRQVLSGCTFVSPATI